ncbi:helix-turn-helix transcriptional regulator [Undibacterium sp. TJN25]|uniref:helix-turn-helix transcriptional regulator n=1 Tax=Undibacterium sp. TJN25 TaxID=3413056 RepID=UPI003BF20C75
MESSKTDDDFDSAGLIPPDIRPGKILLDDFLIPLTRPKEQVAQATGLGMEIIDGILDGKVEITADIGAVLDRHFGVEHGFWLRVQCDYDQAIKTALSAEE